MRALILPIEVGTKVMDYLTSRPYREVHALVGLMMALEPLVEPETGEAAAVPKTPATIRPRKAANGAGVHA